jgi:hypothetical protein
MELQLNLKKGKILYRTPSSLENEGIFGHYYSTKQIASLYKTPEKTSIYKFKTKKILKLLDFSNKDSFKFLDSKLKGKLHTAFQTFTGYGIKELHIVDTELNEDLCIYKNKPKYTIQLCPYTPALNSKEFGNKTLSKELCKLGYDGYYMPQIYLDAQVTDEDYVYHEEYFICDPKNVENIDKV